MIMTSLDDLNGTLSTAEVAGRIGCSVRQVQRLAKNGEIDSYRVGPGQRLRIPKQSVIDFLQRYGGDS